MTIEEPDGSHYWDASVDAATGELLVKVDLVDPDNVRATAAAIGPASGTTVAAASDAEAKQAAKKATYRVFELPLDSPLDGPRTLVKTRRRSRPLPSAGMTSTAMMGPSTRSPVETTSTPTRTMTTMGCPILEATRTVVHNSPLTSRSISRNIRMHTPMPPSRTSSTGITSFTTSSTTTASLNRLAVSR
jgi:hypothetical protein